MRWPPQRGCQPSAPTSSRCPSCSKLTASSKRGSDAGGFRRRRLGSAGFSARNSAHEKTDCCGPEASFGGPPPWGSSARTATATGSDACHFVGAKDRYTGQVSAKVVARTDAETLQGFIHERAMDEAMVYTDEARAYQGLPYHKAVKHGVGEYVNEMAHTNGIESFWAGLKRGCHGVYHQMSAKHLDRYVREFAGRHNDRNQDTIEQMRRTARRMVGKRLKYAELVASRS